MRVLILAGCGLIAATAGAAPLVDGTLDGDYGSPLAVQTVQTQFGDNSDAATSTASGSELNAAYGRFRMDESGQGRMYVTITGNLESNFNKLEMFIDSVAGGMNKIDSLDLPVVEPWGTNNLDNMQGERDGIGVYAALEGTTFDTGFAADYSLHVVNGNEGSIGDTWAMTAHYGQLSPIAAEKVNTYLGGTTTAADPGGVLGSIGLTDSTGPRDDLLSNPSDIRVAIDNSNTAGVTGGTDALDAVASDEAAAVTTGIEFSISMIGLGRPMGDVKINAWVNGGPHDFASNRVLGGLPGPQSNLGGDGNGNYQCSSIGCVFPDFNQFAGDQFFSVPLLPGDADLDDAVTASKDGAILLSNLSTGGTTFEWVDGDFNADREVTASLDGAILLAGLSTDTTAVPEPGSIFLLGLGAAWTRILFRRR